MSNFAKNIKHIQGMTFDEFHLNEHVLEAISYMNFEKASPIQELAIPVALQGRDILACAQTGTGKTASYVIPILNDLSRNKSNHTTSLIIVPTRELAVQINQEIQGFSYFTDASSKAVYGGDKGTDWCAQKQALTGGTNIIVSTPGRLVEFIKQENVNFEHLRHLVLDEADRMLDMGFLDDVMRIMCALPDKRQTLMFSATMPPNISKLAHKILVNPEKITLAVSKPAENIRQLVYVVHPSQKVGLIHHLLESHPHYDSIIIFSSTKRFVHKIVSSLQRKLDADQVEGISSDFEQKDREKVLMRFRAKQTKILVATDVMSRGIDIKGVNLVVNFDTPADAEDYVHRVGRTARADAAGVAVTLVCEGEFHKLRKIEKLIEREIEKVPMPDSIKVSREHDNVPVERTHAAAGHRHKTDSRKAHKRKETKPVPAPIVADSKALRTPKLLVLRDKRIDNHVQTVDSESSSIAMKVD
jgi:superfamily II DNA/RNA helicase